MKSSLKLVVEYVVTYFEKTLSFKVFDKNNTISSFDFSYDEDIDLDSLQDLYKTFLKDNSLRKFEKCNLVISSFDIGVSCLKLSAKTLSTKSIIENFLIDNFGANYKSSLFVQQESVIRGTSTLHSFFTVPKARVKEAEAILTQLEIKSFGVSLLNQSLHEFMRDKPAIDNCYILYPEEKFTLLAAIRDNQILNCYLIPKENKSSKKVSQLTNLQNVIVSMNSYISKEGEINNLYVCGEDHSFDYLNDLELNILYLDTFNFDEFISSGLSKTYDSMMQDEDKSKNKKSKFDWAKFLGIKKGFTLVEVAVSMFVFAIIATVAFTFVGVAGVISEEGKRELLAQSYINNVYELFVGDPSEGTIKEITKYTEDDLIGNYHSYYLDKEMNVFEPSSLPDEMNYVVTFLYHTEIVHEHPKYIFLIESIMSIEGSESYIDPIAMKVIK